MRNLLFSPGAQIDLHGIYDFTIETWGLKQAEHYVRKLHETCHNLAMGILTGADASHIRQGYFKKSHGSHYIFYKHTDPNNESHPHSAPENEC